MKQRRKLKRRRRKKLRKWVKVFIIGNSTAGCSGYIWF